MKKRWRCPKLPTLISIKFDLSFITLPYSKVYAPWSGFGNLAEMQSSVLLMNGHNGEYLTEFDFCLEWVRCKEKFILLHQHLPSLEQSLQGLPTIYIWDTNYKRVTLEL